MISCGEPSGDLYAGALATELLAQEPSTTIVGFGGDRLAASGATLVENFSGLSVTGLLEVVRILPGRTRPIDASSRTPTRPRPMCSSPSISPTSTSLSRAR